MKTRVLFVDDDRSVLKTCKRILLDENINCITFNSPFRALKRIEQIQPAVVISDQKMPGMNGTQFLSKVKTRYPKAIRMLMTGFSDINSLVSAINFGHVFRFIEKPWSDETLKNNIREAIEYYRSIEKTNSNDKFSIKSTRSDGERLQGVIEMGGAVCHEFSQPLQIISGYLQLLQSAVPKDEMNEKFFLNIQQQILRAGDMLNKIMTIHRYHTIEYPDNVRIIDIARSSGENCDE